jgi:cell division protein FtsB
MAGSTNLTNAQCTLGTSQTNTFDNYIKTCRTNNDTARANNFFNTSTANFNDSFETLRAQFDNLLISGSSVSTLADLSGATGKDANRQLDSLQKRKDTLRAEIKTLRSQVEGIDRQFLDDIMNGTPKYEVAPSLQDGTLLLFWFAWIIMSITIVAVRWLSPTGGWKAGTFTLLLMLLVTICIHALLTQVA